MTRPFHRAPHGIAIASDEQAYGASTRPGDDEVLIVAYDRDRGFNGYRGVWRLRQWDNRK